ncbi:unnamed protein product [Tetraodon nigroviridis]|uniref:Peptidyl-prolyl cis-trans isomerase n=1 Tax=Tetraodon nigroviridis TaxID=99883 RepID=Q4S256_TETNG|nr:unnamed protein product [Tetraodon nigroviridis]
MSNIYIQEPPTNGKDEFHTRLRFIRRGLVAMANAGPHDNGSQFFFTLGRADELNNKHTIFGKVTGDTIYNLLRLAEVQCDSDERPLKPHKIRTTEVLHSPFDDIIPRELKKPKKEKEEEKKSQSKATKNFSLLSFGEEAEEDEEMVNQVSETLKGKSKSSHDLLKDDPRLSSVPAVKKYVLNTLVFFWYFCLVLTKTHNSASIGRKGRNRAMPLASRRYKLFST